MSCCLYFFSLLSFAETTSFFCPHPFFYFLESTVLWVYDAGSLGNRFQTFRSNLIFPSSRVWGPPLDPWRWRHQVPSKRPKPITQRHGVIPKECSQRHRSDNIITFILFFLPFLFPRSCLYFFFVCVSFSSSQPTSAQSYSFLLAVAIRACNSVFRDAARAARLDPRAAVWYGTQRRVVAVIGLRSQW